MCFVGLVPEVHGASHEYTSRRLQPVPCGTGGAQQPACALQQQRALTARYARPDTTAAAAETAADVSPAGGACQPATTHAALTT